MDVVKTYPCHKENFRRGRTQTVQYIVIHYVGAEGGAEANARYYHTSGGIGASAHYFVGHATEGCPVYASVAEGDTAWHCGRADGKYVHPLCRNANSVGVELCCRRDGAGRWYIEEETRARGQELTRALMKRYGLGAERVLRHYDVTGKRCPEPYVRDPAAWADFRRGLVEKPVEEKKMEAAFERMYEQVNPLYTALDQVPEYWREETRSLMEAGALRGDGRRALVIRREALGALIAAGRYMGRVR